MILISANPNNFEQARAAGATHFLYTATQNRYTDGCAHSIGDAVWCDLEYVQRVQRAAGLDTAVIRTPVPDAQTAMEAWRGYERAVAQAEQDWRDLGVGVLRTSDDLSAEERHARIAAHVAAHPERYQEVA